MSARSTLIGNLAYVAIAFCWPSVLIAQSAVPPNIVPRSPIAVGANGGDSAAPDWLVWRAFHDSLEFYDKQKPGVVIQLLDERVGLSEASAAAVSEAGRAYLGALEDMDREVRERIKREYQSNGVFVLPPGAKRPNGDPIPSDFLAGKTQDGRELHDVLVADGIFSKLEQRRRSALGNHLRQLTELIGAKQLALIEDWIRADVAPHVGVGTRALRVASPPDPNAASAATE